ncbi:MAG: thiamine pyrophosphate-dependent enzyme [Halobacteriota archaeon]
MRKFISDHEKVIVIEESEPFIESHISICENVLGKMTGHLPYGRIEKEHISFAIDNFDKDKVTEYTEVETIEKRGARSLCEDCLFLPVYRILHGLDILVAGDMGCSIRSAPAPLEAVDVGFALGAAISTGSGFDKKSVAVIGDFGLAHSGILGLINAIWNKRDLLVMVLDNRTAAMTGGQSTPDLTETVRALCDDVTIFEFNDPGLAESRIKELEDLVKDKLSVKGVSVIYVRAECVLYR